jgi:hypothetical protein
MPGVSPNLATGRRITRVALPVRNYVMTIGHAKKVQPFSLQWLFPIDSQMHLT